MNMVASVSIARASTPRKWYVCASFAAGAGALIGLIVGVLARQPEQAFWIVIVISALLVFAFFVLDRSKHVRFEIADGRLFVRGDIFCWRFPVFSMNLGPSVCTGLDAVARVQAATEDYRDEHAWLSVGRVLASEWPSGHCLSLRPAQGALHLDG